MTKDERTVLADRRAGLLAACALVAASVSRTGGFEPDAEYTPEEREPFDALSDRFVRAVETAIGFLRSYERFVQGVAGTTLRDTLHTMEKLGLITDTERWMDMRDVRNRIVHDYSPGEVQRLYADMRGPFFGELQHLGTVLPALSFEEDRPRSEDRGAL
jgi:hypothetical protein